MKAVMYEDIKKLSFKDVPNPGFDKNSIMIRVKYSYICATDIKTYKQGHPAIKPPTILGHEFSGVIEKTGEDVSHFKPGDFVAGIPFVNCGECEYCIRGKAEACPNRRFPSNGALAEYISMSEEYALKGLAKVSEEKLAESGLAEPLSCVLTSCGNMELKPGDSALVVGAGFMGVLNAYVLKNLYGLNVAITDINTARLELPKKLGITIDDGSVKSFNTIILTAPIPEIIQKYLVMVKPFGNISLFGGYPKGVMAEFDPNIVHYKGVKILGSTGFSPYYFRAAIEAINHNILDLEPFTHELYSFDKFNEAFEDAVAGRSLKAGIEM